MRISLAALLVLGCIGTRTRPALAALEAPSAHATIVNRMNATLEPDRPSVRTLIFRVSGPEGDSQITVGKARRKQWLYITAARAR